MSQRGFVPDEPDEFENPLLEPEITEDGFRQRRPRDVRQWQKTAAASHPPEYHFTCCGTVYGAMTSAALAVTRQVHIRVRHQNERAPREENP